MSSSSDEEPLGSSVALGCWKVHECSQINSMDAQKKTHPFSLWFHLCSLRPLRLGGASDKRRMVGVDVSSLDLDQTLRILRRRAQALP